MNILNILVNTISSYSILKRVASIWYIEKYVFGQPCIIGKMTVVTHRWLGC